MRIGSFSVFLALAAPVVYAQGGVGWAPSTVAPSGPNRSFTTSVMPPYNTPGVTGAPYSAELIRSTVRTLADGGHITNEGPSQRMYRDSQGRTRTERAMGFSRPGVPPMPVIIEIRDPNAGVAYILDPTAKVAHRVKLQPPPGGMDRPPRTVSPTINRPPGAPHTVSSTNVMSNGVEMKTEYLGTQTIEGVEAEGRRTTTTYPAGFNGADRPIASVSETWSSPYFDTAMLSKTSDPRMGETSQKLIDVKLTEPDPALFMPPVDYTVVDDPGPQVKIAFPAQ